MKKIKIVYEYFDLQLKKKLLVGDELTVSDDRAAELCSVNNKAGIILAELITESYSESDTESEPVKKSRKKKTEG